MSDQQCRHLPTQSQLEETGSQADYKPFKIREYVFACRQKDIRKTWPFGEKYLQWCLDQGMKEVLPPLVTPQTSVAGYSNLVHSQSDDDNNNKEDEACKAEVSVLIHDQPQNITNGCDNEVINNSSSHFNSANSSQPSCILPSSTHTVKGRRRSRKPKYTKLFIADISTVAQHTTQE